jgi:prefoldin alpha subunit
MEEREKLMYQFQMLQTNADQIKKQTQAILMKVEELELAKKSLEEIKNLKKSPAFIPIGAGNLVSGHVDNVDKIMVDIGGGIVLEETPADALKRNNKKIEDIKKVLTNLTMQEQVVQKQLMKLQPEIQKLLAG